MRLKNKGRQAKKRGRKRPKYEAPIAEHPETKQDIADKDIQANRLEGQNAAVRRRNSAYRRRTNTYAKDTSGLQRTLDMNWVYHNFSRQHFTTKLVPAVALGIATVGLSITELLQLPILR